GSGLEYDWRYGYCSETRTPCAPHTIYGACKHALQILTSAMARDGSFASAWARIFFVYGPHEHPDRLVAAVVRSLLAGDPARAPHGRQVRDYLFVEDVADALARLLESDVTGPINVASGQAIALRDIISEIGQQTGRAELIQRGAIAPASTAAPPRRPPPPPARDRTPGPHLGDRPADRARRTDSARRDSAGDHRHAARRRRHLAADRGT